MSLVLTTLEKAVQPSSRAMTQFENRMPQDSIIRAFQDGTSGLINERAYVAAKKSLSRPVDIAVLKYEPVFVDTIRKINPTPNIAASAKVTLNWSTIAFSFLVSEDINESNYIAMADEVRQMMFNSIMSSMYRDPTKALELTLAAFLEANKMTQLPTVTSPGIGISGGAYEMTAEKYLLAAPVVMTELENYGPYADIANIGTVARRREEATYGRNNSRDLSQFSDQFKYYMSNKIVVPDGKIESHFLLPQNSVGMLNWVEPAAVRRDTPHDGTYSVVRDPFVGLDWGVFTIKERADLSGTYGPGFERAVTTRFDFATSIAPLTAYSSQPGVTPIVKMNVIEQ